MDQKLSNWLKSDDEILVGQRAMLGVPKRDGILNNTIRQRTKVKDIVEDVPRINWRWPDHEKNNVAEAGALERQGKKNGRELRGVKKFGGGLSPALPD